MVAKVGSNTFHPVRAITSAHNDIQIPRTILRLRPATAIVAAGRMAPSREGRHFH